MAHEGLFFQKFGPLILFDLDYGPLEKKVGHSCSASTLALLNVYFT